MNFTSKFENFIHYFLLFTSFNLIFLGLASALLAENKIKV